MATIITNAHTNGKAIAKAKQVSRFAGRKIRSYHRPMNRWWFHPALRDGHFTRLDVPAMLQDNAVQIGLYATYGPLFGAEFEVVANSPEIKRFVENTLYRFWHHDLPKVLPHYITTGTAIGEVMYEKNPDSGYWQYAGLDDFDMNDVQALRNPATRHLTGARVSYGSTAMTGMTGSMTGGGGPDSREWNVIRPPKLFWCAHKPLCGELFGRSAMEASWAPWQEKRGAHGGISCRRLWMFSNAFRGCLVKYPPGTTTKPNGEIVDNQDIAREMAEAYSTGAALFCPSGTDEQGHPLWEIVDPQLNGDVKGLLEYPTALDREIWQGMGVLDEVIHAPDTGGSWSGRSGPLLIFLNICDMRVREIVTAFDVGASGYTTRNEQSGGVIRPLVLENFGLTAKYQIKPISLVPKPPAEGGGAAPGGAGAKPDAGAAPGGAAPKSPMGPGPAAAAMGKPPQPAGPKPISLSGVELPDDAVAGILAVDVPDDVVAAILGGDDVALSAFEESAHPRGQPENAGEFGPGGGKPKELVAGKTTATEAAAFKIGDKVKIGGTDYEVLTVKSQNRKTPAFDDDDPSSTKQGTKTTRMTTITGKNSWAQRASFTFRDEPSATVWDDPTAEPAAKPKGKASKEPERFSAGNLPKVGDNITYYDGEGGVERVEISGKCLAVDPERAKHGTSSICVMSRAHSKVWIAAEAARPHVAPPPEAAAPEIPKTAPDDWKAAIANRMRFAGNESGWIHQHELKNVLDKQRGTPSESHLFARERNAMQQAGVIDIEQKDGATRIKLKGDVKLSGLFDETTVTRGEGGRFTFRPIKAEDVKAAKKAFASHKLSVEHTAEPVTSAASGEPIHHHVELAEGLHVHPDELHRLRIEDGETVLHPDEDLTIHEPSGHSAAKSFSHALHKIASFKNKPDDPVTIVSGHGYSSTRPRYEWMDMHKAATEPERKPLAAAAPERKPEPAAANDYPDPLDLTAGNVAEVWEKMRDEIAANDAKISPNQAGQLAAARILNGVKKRAAEFIEQMDDKVRNQEPITDEEDAKYVAAGEVRRSIYDTLTRISGYRPFPDDDENPLANRPFDAPPLTDNVAAQQATVRDNETKAADVAASIGKTKHARLAKSKEFDRVEREKNTERKRQQTSAEWMQKNGYTPWRGDTTEGTARKKREVVQAAIGAGKTVPPEVLADYPDLAEPERSQTPRETFAAIDKQNHDFTMFLQRQPEGATFTIPGKPSKGSSKGTWQKVSIAGDPFWKNEATGTYRSSGEFHAVQGAIRDALTPPAGPPWDDDGSDIVKLHNSLNIPRDEMPQIPSKQTAAFLDELRAAGVSVERGEKTAGKLKPIQSQLSKKQMAIIHGLPKTAKGKPIIVSNDDYIMDGHHHWGGVVGEDAAQPIDVWAVDLPMTELLEAGRNFGGSTRKTIAAIDPRDQRDPEHSFSTWYDAAGHLHTGRHVEHQGGATEANEADTAAFFQPGESGQGRLAFSAAEVDDVDGHDEDLLLSAAFVEREHPRGQPGNAGEFGPGRGSKGKATRKSIDRQEEDWNAENDRLHGGSGNKQKTGMGRQEDEAKILQQRERGKPVSNYTPMTPEQREQTRAQGLPGEENATVAVQKDPIAAGTDLGAAPAKTPSIMGKATDATVAAYKFLHHKGEQGYDKLPKPVKIGIAIAFCAWTANQSLYERASIERGATPEAAAATRKNLLDWDLALFKPLSVVAPWVGGMVAGPEGASAAAAATWIITPVTAAYLVGSTAKDPMATYRAAKSLVKEIAATVAATVEHHTVRLSAADLVREDIQLSGASEGEPTMKLKPADQKLLVQATEKHKGNDWYSALLHAAMDETHDAGKAIQVADRVFAQHPEDKSVPRADDAQAVFAAPDQTMSLSATWEESKHKRGQPTNAGQFGPGGKGGGKGKAAPMTSIARQEAEGKAERAADRLRNPAGAPKKPEYTPLTPEQREQTRAQGMPGAGGTVAVQQDAAPTGGTLPKETYVAQAMKGLMKTSRTAAGTVDTSASAGKAAQMAAGLTGDDAAKHAANNFKAVIGGIFDQRHQPFDATRVMAFADNVNAQINKGITKEGVLLRTDDSDKFPYTKVADLPLARHQFAEEFAQRLNDPTADPIETAAWVEWRVNRDHSYADGCGKTQRALAALPLMRADLPLPNYDKPAKFFAHMPTTPPDPKQGPESYTSDPGYQKYLDYYRMKCPAHGSQIVRNIEKQYPPANPLGNDAMERHQKPDGTYTPERAALHATIKAKIRGNVPASQDKTFMMMGGGPASGKSSVIKAGMVKLSQHHVHLDSDAIKAELPEFQSLKSGADMRAADYVHEESSDLAKGLQADSFKAGQDVVLDGTGDNSIEGVEGKVKKARDAGYKVHASYTTCSTEEAVRRNVIRAYGGEKARAMGHNVSDAEMKQKPEGRLPPEDMLRAVHKGVSSILPEAVKRGLFDHVQLFDTEHKDANGKPTLVMSAQGTAQTIHHPELWQKFVGKGQ